MSDYIETLLRKISITGSDAIALQGVVGLLLVALSLTNYTTTNNLFSILGILFGGYLILKAIK